MRGMKEDARNRLLGMCQDGLLDPLVVVGMFVRWNTNDDVEDMCHANEVSLNLDDDEEDSDDG